jgi:branched-chain amino acid transport system ATP-binding protein
LASSPAAQPLLSLDDVEAGYGRAALVLRGLTVHVPPATVVCLVGPNGAGKSTALKVASGMLPPRSGTITVAGRDVTRNGPQEMLACGLAHVLQGHSVFREMTVEENVLLGAYTVRDKTEIADRVDFVKTLFPVVAERWSALAGALSGGQQKQVEFARALMVRPRVMLLDEPSMGLDPKATGTVFEQVVRMREAGLAVLMVEQNARRALEIADLGCVLDLGRVHISGPAPDLLADPQLASLYLGGRARAATAAASLARPSLPEPATPAAPPDPPATSEPARA